MAGEEKEKSGEGGLERKGAQYSGGMVLEPKKGQLSFIAHLIAKIVGGNLNKFTDLEIGGVICMSVILVRCF